MLDKYVEERFPRYFVFGTHQDGRVDVVSTLVDPVVTVDKEAAARLIQDHNAAISMLCNMAQAFDAAAPDIFSKFWYGEINSNE